jgi:hypothetical protein
MPGQAPTVEGEARDNNGPEPAPGSHYLYTYAQAAYWLRVAPDTLSRWVRTGKVPARLVTRFSPRIVRFTGDQIVQIIDLYAAQPPQRKPRRVRRV